VALISSASFSARRALVADNVKAQQLTRALGTDAVFLSLGFIAGPALAGILAKLVSVEAALLAITAVYAVGAVLVPRRHKTSVGLQPGSFPTTMEPEDGGGPLRVFAWFWRVKPVQTILLLTVAVEFFAFNFVSLAPIVTATTLAGGAGLLGLLRTGFALGESAGNGLALVLGNRLSRFPEFFFGMAVAVQAVAMLLGLSGAVVPVLLLFTVLGLLGAQFEILQSRLLIENTPASTRARILGIQQAAWGAGALGGLISGVIASAFTPRVSLVGMATFGLLIALAIWRCRRATLGRWRDR
jgi:MFS family permease